MKKTTILTSMPNDKRKWFIVDANSKNLGQLSVVLANKISGKTRVDYTPHIDAGDYIVVLNCDKIIASGKKEEQKKYYRHSGYLGNLKVATLKEVRVKDPKRILHDAVSGMISKTKLRKNQMKRLILIKGDENPHKAQSPVVLEV